MSAGSVYSDLLPVLIQCFAIILFGYLCGRLRLIGSTEGLKVFVTYFALPAIAFQSLATLKLGDVNWKFLASVFLAKTIVFAAAAILTLLLSRRPAASYAGLYAIASSQSNDFALGYPLISDLYRQTHPTFSHYLYLVAPIQLILLNPIGFALMEYGTKGNAATSPPFVRKLIFSVAGIVKNPVIFMPIVALIWNVSTNASPIPDVCLKLIESLGSAFSASALFLLGLNMVGQLGSMEKYAALTPVLIVSAKIVACPLLLRHLVHVLQVGTTEQETKDFGSFGFLYGMLPTAPSVFIFAAQYELPAAAVSTSMVAGTLLSAPFIFVSATVAQLSESKLEDFSSTLRTTVIYTGVVSALCSLWVLIVLSQKINRVTHSTTFCLVLSQLILAVGGMLWMAVPQGTTTLFQSVFALSGTFASRIWTAMLSILLAMLHWRSLCFVLRIRWMIVIGGFLASAAITAALTIAVMYRPTHHGLVDPNFHYGDVQANVAAAVLSVTLVITILGMIVQQRFRMQTYGYAPLPSSDDSRTVVEDPSVNGPDGCTGNCETCDKPSPSLPDVEDLLDRTPVQHLDKHYVCKHGRLATNATFKDFDPVPSTSTAQPEDLLCGPQFDCSRNTSECLAAVEEYTHQLNSRDTSVLQDEDSPPETDRDPHQVFRHLIFLILLCTSMVIGLAVSLWRPLTDAPTGILLELEFIDILLNYGQGILAFMVFGLDATHVINPLLARAFGRRLQRPPESQAPARTKQMCNQLTRHHYGQCVAEIESPRTGANGVHQQFSFEGSDLVDWQRGTVSG